MGRKIQGSAQIPEGTGQEAVIKNSRNNVSSGVGNKEKQVEMEKRERNDNGATEEVLEEHESSATSLYRDFSLFHSIDFV